MAVADELAGDGIAGAASAFYGVLAALRAGDASEARRFLDIHAGSQGGRVQEITAGIGWGGVAMLEGRPADARAAYAEAQRLAREGGYRLWLAQADLDIVRFGAMEEAERRQAADEAREIFTGLRADRVPRPVDEALERTDGQGRPRATRAHGGADRAPDHGDAGRITRRRPGSVDRESLHSPRAAVFVCSYPRQDASMSR